MDDEVLVNPNKKPFLRYTVTTIFMNIVITSRPEPSYLLVESTGEMFTKDDLVRQSQLIHEEIVKHKAKKVLVNEPGTKFPLELLPYYELVKFYVDNFPPGIRRYKIAIVIAAEYEKMARFWETVCINRGLQYFAFTSFQEAHDWLLNEPLPAFSK